jgi:hypothetical protein
MVAERHGISLVDHACQSSGAARDQPSRDLKKTLEPRPGSDARREDRAGEGLAGGADLDGSQPAKLLAAMQNSLPAESFITVHRWPARRWFATTVAAVANEVPDH